MILAEGCIPQKYAGFFLESVYIPYKESIYGVKENKNTMTTNQLTLSSLTTSSLVSSRLFAFLSRHLFNLFISPKPQSPPYQADSPQTLLGHWDPMPRRHGMGQGLFWWRVLPTLVSAVFGSVRNSTCHIEVSFGGVLLQFDIDIFSTIVIKWVILFVFLGKIVSSSTRG